MIRATMKGRDGRPIMLLGITDHNIRRMREGDPVVFDGTALGYDGLIAIVTGTDEQAIAQELKEKGLTMPDVEQDLPPLECPDPELRIPYIICVPVGENHGGLRMRWEKGIPDNLKFWVRDLLSDAYINKVQGSENMVELVNKFIASELNKLVDAGKLKRAPFKSERYWVFKGEEDAGQEDTRH